MQEVERVDRIVADLDGLEAAYRMAAATHKPAELSRTGRDIRSRFKLHRDSEQLPPDREAAVLAKLAKVERIERRNRRKG